MRATIVVAGIEGVLVLLWIASFSSAIGTPHQRWYVELPLWFLLEPAVGLISAFRFGRSSDRSIWLYATLLLLLIANFLAFVFYGMMSGGGV